MDRTICQQKKDWVCTRACDRANVRVEFFQERRKESRPAQFNLLKGGFVGVSDLLDTLDLRILSLAIDCKTVVDSIDTHVSGYATESKDRKRSVFIVRLHDTADVKDRLLVLVQLLANVVKRV